MVSPSLPSSRRSFPSPTFTLFGQSHPPSPTPQRMGFDRNLGGEGSWSLSLRRTRGANAVIALLLLCLGLSLLGNLRSNTILNQRIAYAPTPASIRATLSSPHSGLNHMVMVPGHAIWKGCEASDSTRDSEWVLEPYQRGGTVRTFIRHITKAAEIAVQDPLALLIYSGGQTRAHSDMSEATSYARLAKAGDLYAQFSTDPTDSAEFERVTTEEFALDSFENILFSIARFKEFTGNYPERITVVGFGMKRRRYEDVHRAALRFPSSSFRYIGIDNENTSGGDYSGEAKGGLEPFLKDSYGCKTTLLAKRRNRNPYRRFHPYFSSCGEIADLFEYCPADNEMFPGKLPWSEAL